MASGRVLLRVDRTARLVHVDARAGDVLRALAQASVISPALSSRSSQRLSGMITHAGVHVARCGRSRRCAREHAPRIAALDLVHARSASTWRSCRSR